MSEQIKNGGPVFPITDCASHQFHGMTLRDYFAAKAMPAIVAAASAGYHLPGGNECGGTTEDRIAFDAYKLADAMLAARGDA